MEFNKLYLLIALLIMLHNIEECCIPLAAHDLCSRQSDISTKCVHEKSIIIKAI